MSWQEPERLWCALCLIKNFLHVPNDQHILHGPSCDVENHKAVTIIDGRSLCIDHALEAIQGDNRE